MIAARLVAIVGLAAALAAQGTMTITTAKESLTLPWKDDTVFAEILKGLSDRGGGTIAFSEGTFVFDRGVNIQGVKGLTLTGVPGATIWKFRALDEWGKIKTTSAVKIADKKLIVDNPQYIVAGRRYQAYYPDQRGGRCVEMAVKSVVEPGVTPGAITLGFVNATHPGLTEIPAGAWIVPEINFIDGWILSDITVKGITFDGGHDPKSLTIDGKPYTTGHTTLCGLVFRAPYKDRAKKPAGRNLRVEQCVFRNLAGRGFVAYNTEGVVVKGCVFDGVRTEACEIDHWCDKAEIRDCTFKGGFSGVQLNDCNGVTVAGCTFDSVGIGVNGLDAMKDPLTNKDWTIEGCSFKNLETAVRLDANVMRVALRRNTFMRPGKTALDLLGSEITVEDNVFDGCGPTPWGIATDRVKADRNTVR